MSNAMNIFATSVSPAKSARYLDDQRVVKMILESCQMLSTAAARVKYSGNLLLPTHDNHPCNIWVRSTSNNFLWLWEHALELDAERQRRFKHSITHKSIEQLNKAKIWKAVKLLQTGELEEFANCARNVGLGIDFTHVTPVTKAYRLYLKARWAVSNPRFTEY